MAAAAGSESRSRVAAVGNVGTLIEALPYIREFRGRTFVIRCAADLTDAQRNAICGDVALLRYVGVKAVLVHPHDDGERARSATDARQRVNHQLVNRIGEYVNATGLSGSDGAPRWLLSLDDAGELSVNPDLVLHVIDDYTPVIEAVAVDAAGEVVSADADLAAAQLAVALQAYKVIFAVGQYRVSAGGCEVSEMRAGEDVLGALVVPAPIDGAVHAGVRAVRDGVDSAHVIPGDSEHAVLLELFTDAGHGTKIIPHAQWSADLPAAGYWCWPLASG